MTKEQVREKVDAFLKMNENLQKELGIFNAVNGDLPYPQTHLYNLLELRDKYNVVMKIEKRTCTEYPWRISIDELKLFAISDNTEMKYYGLL